MLRKTLPVMDGQLPGDAVHLNLQGDVSVEGDLVGRDKNVTNLIIDQEALVKAGEARRLLARAALEKSVLACRQRLVAQVAEAAAGSLDPYPGLQYYRLSDAKRFFGRSQAIDG